MSYVEFIIQGVDMADSTYLTWESERCAPQFRVIDREAVAPLLAELKRALPGFTTDSNASPHGLAGGAPSGAVPVSEEYGSSDLSAVHDDDLDDLEEVAGVVSSKQLSDLGNALDACLMNREANLKFMRQMTMTLELDGFLQSLRTEILEEAKHPEAERRQVLLIVNPPPSLGQFPWELIPLDGWDDTDSKDKVLQDVADIITMAPMLARDADSTIPHPDWSDGAGLYLIQPWDPSVSGHGMVLSSTELRSWRGQLQALRDDSDYLVGEPTDRLWLSKKLIERSEQNSADPVTRFLYIGHVEGEGGSSSLLLNDDEEIYGLRDADEKGIRWFSAGDLMHGTMTWRETKFKRISESLGSGFPVPNGDRFPSGVVMTTDEFNDEHVTEIAGKDLWPMPPRVGLVACHSGSESSSHEPFGLTTACLEAGAELVLATRWTMYTDGAFFLMGRDLLKHDPDRLRQTIPFFELGIKVDEILQSHTPIKDMSDWKREQYKAWIADPTDLGAAPITWAGLTAFRAPNRHYDGPVSALATESPDEH